VVARGGAHIHIISLFIHGYICVEVFLSRDALGVGVDLDDGAVAHTHLHHTKEGTQKYRYLVHIRISEEENSIENRYL
jgi:hypothetical protein